MRRVIFTLIALSLICGLIGRAQEVGYVENAPESPTIAPESTRTSHSDTWYQYVHQLLTTGVLRISDINGWGSGFCIKHIDGDSYILTAYHVVDAPLQKTFRVDWNKKGAKVSLRATLEWHSAKHDLALLKVPGVAITPIFLLASDVDYSRLKSGDLLFGAGFNTQGIWPAIPTFGMVRAKDLKEGHLHHSVGGWFGFSGSPTLGKDGLVYGMVQYGLMIRGKLSSIHGGGVGASLIREVLEEARWNSLLR